MMAWKAKENILWFKRGDIVESIEDNWSPHFDKVNTEHKEKSTTSSAKKKSKRK